jgi:hypothetical protein
VWGEQLESGMRVLEACGRTADTPESPAAASMLQDDAGEVRLLTPHRTVICLMRFGRIRIWDGRWAHNPSNTIDCSQ